MYNRFLEFKPHEFRCFERDQERVLLVIHRDDLGSIYLAHSPMGEFDVTCSVCTAGAAVYLDVDEITRADG